MSNYTNVSSFSPSPIPHNATGNSTNGSLPFEPSPSPGGSVDTPSPSSSLENTTEAPSKAPSKAPEATPSPEHGFAPSPSYAPSPDDQWIPSPSSFVPAKSPSPSSMEMAHNTTPSFEPDPILVIDEVVDWAVGAVFFGIIAVYCCIIFYPGKCKRMAGWMKTRHFKPELEYGVVEDEADKVELTASITGEMYKDTRQNVREDNTQWKNTMESMI